MEMHVRMFIISTWMFLEFKDSSAICTIYDLHGQNKNDVFECNYPATLSCSNRPNIDIEWYIGSPIDSKTSVAAQCRGTVCTTFDTFSGRYSYSFDQGSGIANITIRNVSSNDKGLEYRCEDGSTPPPFLPKIKVFPNDKTTTPIISSSGVNNQLNFTVSTDCVLLSRNMSFIWKKTKNENGTELESFTQDEISRGIVIIQNEANCSHNGSCGETIYFSSLLFKPGNFGERFYIHCTIVVNDEFGPANITRISTTAYQLKDATTGNDGKTSPLSTGVIVGIVVASIASGVILVVIVVIRFSNWGKTLVGKCKDSEK